MNYIFAIAIAIVALTYTHSQYREQQERQIAFAEYAAHFKATCVERGGFPIDVLKEEDLYACIDGKGDEL